MPYNGAGLFSLYSPGNPVITGTVISSTWANNTLSDIATGLSTAITKNGQTTLTSDLSLSGYKLVDIGADDLTLPDSYSNAGTATLGSSICSRDSPWTAAIWAMPKPKDSPRGETAVGLNDDSVPSNRLNTTGSMPYWIALC